MWGHFVGEGANMPDFSDCQYKKKPYDLERSKGAGIYLI